MATRSCPDWPDLLERAPDLHDRAHKPRIGRERGGFLSGRLLDEVEYKGRRMLLIGGQPAARVGDLTAHGGSITLGLPTVLIGG